MEKKNNNNMCIPTGAGTRQEKLQEQQKGSKITLIMVSMVRSLMCVGNERLRGGGISKT